MFYIVTAAVLALVLVLSVVAWATVPKKTGPKDAAGEHVRPSATRKAAGVTAVSALVLLLLVTAGTTLARVGAREVGIETSLGRYSRTLQAGWQVKAPWAEVETFSTQLQRSEMDAPIAFAGGGSGTQHMTVQ